MSARDKRVDCGDHGEAVATFVCKHLLRGADRGFVASTEGPDDPWPDAWCDDCDLVMRNPDHTDEDEAKLGVSLLCNFCYERARARNLRIRRPKNFVKYVTDSCERLTTRQEPFQSRIAGHARYHWDQATRILTLSGGIPCPIAADIDFVGSVSKRSHTWLWGWANPSFDPTARKRMERVREFGVKRSWDALTIPSWGAEEVDGWEMTSVAARVLGAEAAYRTEDENGFLFMLLSNIRVAE